MAVKIWDYCVGNQKHCGSGFYFLKAKWFVWADDKQFSIVFSINIVHEFPCTCNAVCVHITCTVTTVYAICAGLKVIIFFQLFIASDQVKKWKIHILQYSFNEYIRGWFCILVFSFIIVILQLLKFRCFIKVSIYENLSQEILTSVIHIYENL